VVLDDPQARAAGGFTCAQIYLDLLQAISGHRPGGSEKYPEVLDERLWEGFSRNCAGNRLQVRTAGFLRLAEMSSPGRWLFFHISLPDPAGYPGF